MALQGNFATAVADLVDSLVAADKVNINEAIFQSSFMVGNFAQAHNLLTDRRNGNLQTILLSNDPYGSMPLGDETSCTLNECDITPNYSTKAWCLSEYNCRTAICMRSFDENFLLFWNMYRQRLEDPLAEPDAQAFLDYITQIVEERVQGTQWRVGYWGDADSENTFIDGCDGFFLQAEAGDGEKIAIDAASPNAPTGLEIYTAFQEAYEFAMDQPWGAETDLIFKTTYAVASKLVTWLNTMTDTSQYNCDCYDPDGIVATRRFNVEGLRIFGIPVEAHREIDLSANAAGQGDPEAKFKAILTRKSNLLVGTNSTDKLEGFDVFYDKVSKNIYFEAMVYLGVMIPLDDYVYISEQGS